MEKVTNHKLYHFTAATPYKNPFVLGQRVQIGTAHNPFFAFYETSLEYPVTQADGSIINVKAVKFINSVRDGVVNSPNLPQIASECVTHYVMLARELLMENIRQAEFPDLPSRQRCLYACDSLDQARYWRDRIRDAGQTCE